MSQFFDDFSGYSAGALATVGAANWSVVTLSGSWSVVVDLTGGPASEPACIFDNGVSGDANAHAFYDGAGSTAGDIEVYAKFVLDGGYDTNVGFGPMLMQSDNQAYGLAANGTTEVRLLRFGTSSAPSSVIGAALALSLSAPTIYHVRVGRSGSTIRAKIWADGDSEPGTWQMSGTDTTLTTVSAALFARDFSMMPMRVTAFGVGTAGDDAPTNGTGSFAITGDITHAHAVEAGAMTYTAATVTVAGTQANGRELRDENQALITSGTVSWEWYDKTTDTTGNPLDSGTFTPDANGEWSIQPTGSTLLTGQSGTLILELGTKRGIYELTVVRS